jgi:hypothetical protein
VNHATAEALEAALPAIQQAPADAGTVEMIALRPADGDRRIVHEAELDVVTGVVGDNWSVRPNRRTADGAPDPRAQVTLMRSRVAVELGGQHGWVHTGDQLFVDLDLSEENLPPGSRLAVGSAVIEVTDKPHNGCAKFRRHFGEEALKFVNSPIGRRLNLRGINARVVEPGTVRAGDTIRKLRP